MTMRLTRRAAPPPYTLQRAPNPLLCPACHADTTLRACPHVLQDGPVRRESLPEMLALMHTLEPPRGHLFVARAARDKPGGPWYLFHCPAYRV